MILINHGNLYVGCVGGRDREEDRWLIYQEYPWISGVLSPGRERAGEAGGSAGARGARIPGRCGVPPP